MPVLRIRNRSGGRFMVSEIGPGSMPLVCSCSAYCCSSAKVIGLSVRTQLGASYGWRGASCSTLSTVTFWPRNRMLPCAMPFTAVIKSLSSRPCTSSSLMYGLSGWLIISTVGPLTGG
ncbi:hypothetical protein D3C78_1371160 [compost metagenome]